MFQGRGQKEVMETIVSNSTAQISKAGSSSSRVIKFVVPGHPVGYKRTTQAGCRFDKGYKQYQAYKDHVITSFAAQVAGNWGNLKPLTTTKAQRSRVEIMIYFKNGVHADPDNCFKAIADSLFVCDKYVSGTFDFDYDATNPRIEVKIASILLQSSN